VRIRRGNMSEAYDLERFVEAQEGVYETALKEIQRGRKTSHWMWFVFPQMFGLGGSSMARTYGIRSLEEAQAYLEHPVLGARLRECVAALEDLPPMTAEQLLGSVDAMKLCSSLTLFVRAGGGALFTAALERWFGGQADPATDSLIGH
jgi:uncharacterized protein (DUF1810 family)